MKRRNNTSCVVMAVALLCSLVAAQSATAQLVDPGFESVAISFAGDTMPGGSDDFFDAFEGFSGGPNSGVGLDTTNPFAGASHATVSIMGDDNSFAGLFGTIAVMPGDMVTAGIYHLTPDTGAFGAGAEFRIEFHNDDNGGEVGRVDNNVIPGNAYTLNSVSGVVPAGANQARLVYALQTFGGEPDGGASSTGTVFLDNASLAVTQVPEPAALGLVGIAVAGLAIFRRRRR